MKEFLTNRKVASSRLSWLVELSRIFRRLIKCKGYGADVLRLPDGRSEPIFGRAGGSMVGPLGFPNFHQDLKTSLGTSRNGLKLYRYVTNIGLDLSSGNLRTSAP